MRARSILVATLAVLTPVGLVTGCGDAGTDDEVGVELRDVEPRTDEPADAPADEDDGVDDAPDEPADPGAGSGEPFSATQLVAASRATAAVQTAQVEATSTMDLGGLAPGLALGPTTVTMTGEVDFSAGRSAVEVDMSALLDVIAGLDTGESGAIPPQVTSMFAEPMRMVQDATTLYQCWSTFELVAGAPCVRFDLAELAEASGVDAGALPGAAPFDPAAMLDSLGGVDALTEVGSEELFGVTTRRFEGTFSLADALAQLDPADAEDLRDHYGRLGLTDELLDTEHTFEVWIDGDGLVRRIRQRVSLGASLGVVETETSFVAFDVPVDITEPTDFVDVTDLPGLGGLGGLGG